MAFNIPTPLPNITSRKSLGVSSYYRPNPDIGRLEHLFDYHVKERGMVLTASQRRFVEEFFTGANVCLVGAAGTGKSLVSKALFEFLIKNHISVGRTATTGVSALGIGGQTINSFAGLGLGDEHIESIISKVAKYPKVKARLRAIEILFIDEVSMAKGDLLNKLDAVMRHFRSNTNPWGGCQVVFIADFLQLPPIFKGNEVQELAFQSKAWKESHMRVTILKEIVRQGAEQDVLLRVLNDVRVGKTDSLHLLNTRVGVTFPDDGIQPVHIFCKNADVDFFNASRLAKLATQVKTYHARDTGLPHHTDAFNKNCPAPQVLELKVGAQVMLLTNIDVEKRGLVNGSIGVIKAFGPQGVTVKFTTCTAIIDHNEWEIKEQEVGHDKRITYKVVATRSQIPLKPCWAVTTHKVQGMTLDRAIIDMSEAFSTGQVYCSLSRIRTLDSLSIIGGIPHEAVKVNRDCVEFYLTAEKENPS